MKMAVDKTRQEIEAGKIYDFFPVPIFLAYAGNPFFGDGHVGGVNLPAEDVDHLGIFEQKIGGDISLGDVD